MATIYRKTDKGRAEIETRAHRLPPRLRTALIMVDGQRSDDTLRQLILQQPDETLDTLHAGGFIEVVAFVAAPPPPPPAPEPRSEAQAPVAGPPVGMSFEVWRREAVRMLNDSVGPGAMSLALKMEQSADPASLRALLEIARQMIRESRGNAPADKFGDRFIG